MTLRSQATEPVGAVVTGIDLRQVDAALAEQLAGELADRGFVAFPDQHLDDREFAGFLALFGPLAFTAGETPVAGAPELNLVSNVGRDRPPRSVFHTDTSYVRNPPAYTALRAVTVPAAGGATEFTNQYRALSTLPADLRAAITGRKVRHEASGVELGPDDEARAEHPLVLRHPRSGRPALYLSTPQRCRSVSGLSDDRATELLARLYDHSTRSANVKRHRWRAGDVVMWDNRCVLHRADHDGVAGDRVLHRGTVGPRGANP